MPIERHASEISNLKAQSPKSEAGQVDLEARVDGRGSCRGRLVGCLADREA